jgi:hypothetical protein
VVRVELVADADMGVAKVEERVVADVVLDVDVVLRCKRFQVTAN